MKKRQALVTAAVAATAAASGVFGMYASSKPSEISAITKAAEFLGVGQNELLEAFKKAKIEMIEENISKGNIDAYEGIEMIQKIEDITDFHILPKYA